MRLLSGTIRPAKGGTTELVFSSNFDEPTLPCARRSEHALMPFRHETVRIHAEQAVYGSFAFWNRGYDLLGFSPGCLPEWIAAFRDACERFGERPHAARSAEALFTLRLPGGGRMIVGVGESGQDDRGRPGALCFHAIFVSDRDYRRVGGAPFPFEPHLRRRWTADASPLQAETWTIARFDPTVPTHEERALRDCRRTLLPTPRRDRIDPPHRRPGEAGLACAAVACALPLLARDVGVRNRQSLRPVGHAAFF